MSRWRPAPRGATALVTAEGQQRLKAELDDLWRVQRPEVVRALAAAAAEGDRSENAEYTYRKKQLAGIDRRVRYLSKRLPALKVVAGIPADPDSVFFAAHVVLERLDNGETLHYRLVGPDETDAARGLISIDSPLACALLKKRRGDEFSARLPAGDVPFRLLDVRYGA